MQFCISTYRCVWFVSYSGWIFHSTSTSVCIIYSDFSVILLSFWIIHICKFMSHSPFLLIYVWIMCSYFSVILLSFWTIVCDIFNQTGRPVIYSTGFLIIHLEVADDSYSGYVILVPFSSRHCAVNSPLPPPPPARGFLHVLQVHPISHVHFQFRPFTTINN